MILTGKIFDIHKIGEKEAQIVIRKKMGEKIVPVAVNIFGFWYDKAIVQQKLKQGDKIKANLYMKSKFWEKGKKYFTDVYFKDIVIIEFSDPFSDRKTLFDEETGEIFE